MDEQKKRSRLEVARELQARGIFSIAIKPGFKKSVEVGWQKQRLNGDALESAFAGPGNIGVLLGEPSGWLVDVDLDCDEAVALAAQFLPATKVRSGHAARPDSHWWYVAKGAKTKQMRDPVSEEMIVELRSTGGQTLVGPSVNPDYGSLYAELNGEPPSIDATELLERVERLFEAVVMQRHGKSSREILDAKRNARQRVDSPQTSARGTSTAASPDMKMTLMRASKYLANIPGAVSSKGGHPQTYAAATAMVHGFGLSTEDALDLLEREYNPRCQPPWTRAELEHKVKDAAEKPHDLPLGWLRDAKPMQATSLTSNAGKKTIEKVEVVLGTDEHRVIDEVEQIIANDPQIFSRGTQLVRVTGIEAVAKTKSALPLKPLFIEELPASNLRERVTKYVALMKIEGFSLKPAHPPSWLISGLEGRGDWKHLRELVGVSSVPTLRRDGTICQVTGYDAQTKVQHRLDHEFPSIPEHPSADEVARAVATLLDVVGDFHFERPTHRSAFLAAMLTPIARFAFDGPSPMFVVDANVRGAGKGLLCDVISLIATGQHIPVQAYASDQEELRKRITAIALSGDRLVMFDNLDGPLGNGVLDAALTTTKWTDRILGKSQRVQLPLLVTWFATGNNVQLGADTARRVVHIRMDVLHERPEDRDDFKYPDLRAHVKANFPSLLAAALTILRGFIAAGRPAQAIKPMGSFEGWSDLVRQAVVWTGLPDPCEGRDALVRFADTNHEGLGQLLSALREAFPDGQTFLCSEVLERAFGNEGLHGTVPGFPALRNAIESLVPSSGGRMPNGRQLGKKLAHFRRRPVDGWYLDQSDSYDRRGTVWHVVAVPERG